MKKTSLCYIEAEGAFLMLLRNKKKHDYNEGKWIGVGGKFENDETPRECVIREVWEETGIDLAGYPETESPREEGLHFYGVITFCSESLQEDMYLYSAKLPKRPLGELFCEEGELHWIPKEEVLKLNLWEGDVVFLREMLEGKSCINMTLKYQNDRLTEVIREKE